MTLHLPRLTSGDVQVMSAWNKAMVAVEAQFTDQQATIDRIRRLFSHTLPTRVLIASDDGAAATITVADHTRVYGDATTLAITGGAVSGLESDKSYAGYYDDATLVLAAPTFHFTQTIETAQSAAAAGRHFLGVIRTPVAASGDSRTGGGAYPAGSSPGGEL